MLYVCECVRVCVCGKARIYVYVRGCEVCVCVFQYTLVTNHMDTEPDTANSAYVSASP